MPMDAETTVRYLEQLILAERDFAGAADLARMNLHQPLSQSVLDEMQQAVTCALSRLGAAQDMNMPPIPVQAPDAVSPSTEPAAETCGEYAPPVETPPAKEGCCGGGCSKSPTACDE